VVAIEFPTHFMEWEPRDRSCQVSEEMQRLSAETRTCAATDSRDITRSSDIRRAERRSSGKLLSPYLNER
jgi:hypothetical protein